MRTDRAEALIERDHADAMLAAIEASDAPGRLALFAAYELYLDGFITWKRVERQIGNAVSVRTAKALCAEALK